MLAARVGVERPAEAHALDRVEGRLALDLEVLDVDAARLGRVHSPIIEQMFVGLNSLGWHPSGEGPPKVSQVFLRAPGRVHDDGQKSLRTHSSHRGRRAMHTRRPCRIKRSDKPVHSSGGTIAVTCCSILTGSRVETSLIRLVKRMTWVSTAKPGWLIPAPRMTLAVLRPMPGICRRSSMVAGTTPSNSSTSLRLASMIRLDLTR